MDFRLVMNIRTISSVHNGFDVVNTRFFMLLLESRHFACSPSLCGDIFHGHALSCFGDIMACQRRCRDLHIANKAIIDNDPLRSVFTFAFRFKHIDMVDEFTEHRSFEQAVRQRLPHPQPKILPSFAVPALPPAQWRLL